MPWTPRSSPSEAAGFWPGTRVCLLRHTLQSLFLSSAPPSHLAVPFSRQCFGKDSPGRCSLGVQETDLIRAYCAAMDRGQGEGRHLPQQSPQASRATPQSSQQQPSREVALEDTTTVLSLRGEGKLSRAHRRGGASPWAAELADSGPRTALYLGRRPGSSSELTGGETRPWDRPVLRKSVSTSHCS